MSLGRLSLPSTALLYIKSISYLFLTECILLGPAYAFTICCFVMNSIIEICSEVLAQLLNPSYITHERLNRRTVLINGCTQTISLHVARALNTAGYRVIACDFPQNWLNPTRFSFAVDGYYTVPNIERGMQEYVKALCEIVQREKVDIFLPISTAVGSVYDSLAKSQLEREDCQCFIPSPEQVRRLSNKMSFFQLSMKCGFDVPIHYKVTCIAEIVQLYDNGIISQSGTFMLTSLRCNSKYLQDSVVMPNNIDEFILHIGEYDSYSCALLVQEYIPGRHLTTSTTILNGIIVAHSACFCEDSYEYDPEETTRTLTWIEIFVKNYPSQLNGNFIFNFIVSLDNILYPESCVAGVGVAAMTFYPEKEFGEVMLTDVPTKTPVRPSDVRPVFWLYEELWKTGKSFPNILTVVLWLRKLLIGREAVFSFKDPLPFIALNHLHLPFLVFVNLLQRKMWQSINFRAGKLQY